MEILKIDINKERPTESIDWGTNDIKFENGNHQYQQKWTEPEKTYSFSTEGDLCYANYLITFFNAHRGMLIPFYCDLFKDGNLYKYRFGTSKLEPKWHYTAGEGKMGASFDISLIKVKGEDRDWLYYLQK